MSEKKGMPIWYTITLGISSLLGTPKGEDVRTRFFAFLRICQVGYVALLLADQIHVQSLFKNDKVFILLSASVVIS